MTYAEFQEHYEKVAAAERKRFDTLPVAAIVEEIRAGRFGDSYQIWCSLGSRAQPGEANELLLAFLASDADYHHRYHAAAALIEINGRTEWQPEELSAEATRPVAANLAKVRAQLAGA